MIDDPVAAMKLYDADPENARLNAYYDIDPDQLEGRQRYQFDLLILTLEVAVPMWQDQIRHAADMGYDLGYRRERCLETLCGHGEGILFKTRHTAASFNRLAEGLAILSFAPGGVRFGARRWIADPAS